jgi:hypothetical protein
MVKIMTPVKKVLNVDYKIRTLIVELMADKMVSMMEQTMNEMMECYFVLETEELMVRACLQPVLCQTLAEG